MNRDGFSLLAMGFTGKATLDWKVKYIGAFNQMEQAIKTGKLFPHLRLPGNDKTKNNLMGAISKTKLENLKQEKIQLWVNGLAKEKSPKTVANAHGSLSAVLAE